MANWEHSETSTLPVFPLVVLNLQGPLTIGKSAADLRRQVEQHLEHGRNRIIFDLSQVPYLDTSGLGELVRCVKRLGEVSGQMVVVPGAANHSFLERFKLDLVFDLQPDLPAAYQRLEDHSSRHFSKT